MGRYQRRERMSRRSRLAEVEEELRAPGKLK